MMQQACALGFLMALSSETAVASSPGSSPWREMHFQTEAKEEVWIKASSSSSSIESLTIRLPNCEATYNNLSVEGVLNLGKTELYQMDLSKGERELVISSLVPNPSNTFDFERELILELRDCSLVKTRNE